MRKVLELQPEIPICTECEAVISDPREQRCPWCQEPMCRRCWCDRYAGQCSICEAHGSPQVQGHPSVHTGTKQDARGPVSSPDSFGACAGIQGKRSSTEHAVGAANPRTGIMSRAGEAR